MFVMYTRAQNARYNYRFAVTSSSSVWYVSRCDSGRDDCTSCREIRIRYYGQLPTVNSDRRFSTRGSRQNDFLSQWCSLGKLWLDVSKDTESSDSLRKALVQRVREMDVAVNWLNRELVVGKRWQLPLRESC